MEIDSESRGAILKTTKIEFYSYGNTIVVSVRDKGRLGVYSLALSGQAFEQNLPILAEIQFDRSGLAERITRKDFIKRARERGVRELPVDIESGKRAVGSKKRATKKSLNQSAIST